MDTVNKGVPGAAAVVRGRATARGVLAAAYLAAGVLHVTVPEPFLLITPGWVPFPRAVIFGTGLCELAGAAGLLTRRLRRAAGIGLALYAVCVYPANIKHALGALPAGSVQLGLWYHVPRLLLQPVLVWWALFAGEAVTWPFGRANRQPDAGFSLPSPAGRTPPAGRSAPACPAGPSWWGRRWERGPGPGDTR